MKRYIYTEDGKKLPSINIRFSTESRDNLTRLQRYFLEKDNFHLIDKNILFQQQEVSFSIFINKDLNFESVLKATPQSPAKIPIEVLKIQENIFIKASDIPIYYEYLESLQKTTFSEESQKHILREKAKIVVRNVLTNPYSDKNIMNTIKTAENLADSIVNNRDAIYDLISKVNNDFYLYVHSINVAVLSTALGSAIGLTHEEIFNLGVGAILHDIGKSTISPQILYKPYRLSPTEFKIMKSHVFEGQKILMNYKFFPNDSMPAVTQHHEKLSGKGYPLGISAPDIKLFGRIVAIVDCFDSLTTGGPHKYPLNPFSALNVLVKEKENYDRELLELFIKLLGDVKS